METKKKMLLWRHTIVNGVLEIRNNWVPRGNQERIILKVNSFGSFVIRLVALDYLETTKRICMVGSPIML
jgi:hypothetical protein